MDRIARYLPPRLKLVVWAALVCWTAAVLGADGPGEVLPHRQSVPPNPPRTPAEAIAQMTVPAGFTVELVAAEPDLVNPVAMTFDERGRIWVTESLEYPRSSAGPGRDRIKVLEDTTGDGRADRVTLFAEGLNIPSGIAVGYGGVWVANAPDLLFMQDTNGDGRADRSEVVVTGFGRTDTHELPNSLTWGPDGWLYGLNGVFNHSRIAHQGREFQFNCAMFRLDPRTRRFELFAEGTSNPWGIAFDDVGSAFVSACVIDHLWHITETGYYHRQGGPYPPFTWKIESIVKHKHQLAAYCGIHYFDSDAYPPEYRHRLYMGNVHGGCINVDSIRPQGATYAGAPEADFLTANDAWFMPVAQKTGPDGCLYILDWYDRYHCYQDARRDPDGIDRGRGRLYRVRYDNTPRAGAFDLGQATDDELIARLQSPNVYFRDIAQRLLAERANPSTRPRLQALVLDDSVERKYRMHALWALLGTGPLDDAFLTQLLHHADPALRAWGVRAAGNYPPADRALFERVAAMAADRAPEVRLQVAIAAPKLAVVAPTFDATGVLVDVLAASEADPLLPRIVWGNLHPRLVDGAGAFLAAVERRGGPPHPLLAELLPRVLDRLLSEQTNFQPAQIERLIEWLLVADTGRRTVARACLAMLASRLRSGELDASARQTLVDRLAGLLRDRRPADLGAALDFEIATVASTWGEPSAIELCRTTLVDAQADDTRRLAALDALAAAGDPHVLSTVDAWLSEPRASAQRRSRAIDTLLKLSSDDVADVVLRHYPRLSAQVQPQVIELLTSRDAWSRALLQAVADKKIPVAAINENQVRKLLRSKDSDLRDLVTTVWGTVRAGRDPQREQVIAEVRQTLGRLSGDPHTGQQVFQRLCGQCHKIHGLGNDVGPDITVNGRASLDQLLSNVFDPSLVIGAAYRAHTVLTVDGRVITGLLVENAPSRVVLKVQGGKLESLARGEIEEMEESRLSLMPEGVEKQLSEQEIVDLLAFLALDKSPDDPTARALKDFSGVKIAPRAASN